jgi:PAS domain S-box-containing protein
MKTKIRILHVDDNIHDRILVKDALMKENRGFEVVEADNREKFEEYLEKENFDLVLSDFNILGFDGLQVLKTVKDKRPELPVIIVTGTGSEEIAIKAMKMGASDYVIKSVKHIKGLAPTIKAVLDHKKTETERKNALNALTESEEKYRQLVTQSPDGIFINDLSGKFLSVNRAICENLKYTEEELLNTNLQDIIPEKYHSLHKQRMAIILKGEGTNSYAEYEVKGRDGDVHFVEVLSVPYYKGKELIGFQGIARDITERKHMENAIRESEEKYRSIYENSSIAILLTITDGRILSANDNACSLFRMTEKEICEAKREGMVDISDPALQLLLDERVRTGKAKGELTFLRKDGSKFRGEVSSVVFQDKDGNERTSMAIRDLTEQRKAEESLKFRNILLSTQMEVSIDGILIVDENNNIVSLNRRFVEIFNIPETLIDKRDDEPVLRYVTGMIREPEQFLQRVHYLYEHKEETSFEELCLVDGRVIDRNSSPMFGSDGHYYGRLWNFRDVTNRKKAEEKIMKNEARFRSYFESAIAGIAITSPSKGWLEVNDYLCELLGYSKDEIIKFTWAELTHPDDLNIDLENFNKVMMGKIDAYSIEKRFIRKDGQVVWTNMSVRCVRLTDGTVEYFVALLFDISKRKKFEDELIRSKIKAEESDKLKTAFLHNISHEIRTPMNAIIGFSALLSEPGLDEPSKLSFIDVITQSSNHLLDIINDIIEISNIEAGISKISKNEVRINSIIEQLKTQFSPKAVEKGIELNTNTPLADDTAIIQTDCTKLQQIYSNLLSNAFKFTQKGRIEFGYTFSERLLNFYVSDTGIGISDDQHEKIFDRFYQVEHQMARHFEGTGLGLSISKAYVEILGGRIWVESEPGKGSTFYFSLPFNQPESNHRDNLTFIKEVKFNKPLTILVAEDNDANFKLIEMYLADPVFSLIYAKNGFEAVKHCESEQKIDLVLMDLKMPEMDGYLATEKISKLRPGLPVIAQTAFVTDTDKALNSGCVDILTKPFRKIELLQIINKHLNK